MFLHLKKRFFLLDTSAIVPREDKLQYPAKSSTPYDASRTSNSILTSSLALTPAFPGGLIPKSVCFTTISPVYRPSFSTTCTVTVRVCPWESFDLANELTTKGIQKFVADYQSTLGRSA